VFAVGAVPIPGRRPTFMREIPVRLKLDKMDPRVIPDLSASAEVMLDSEPGANIAPLASIFQDGPAAKPYVFVRSADEWQKREVELGLRNNIAVTIRSGLHQGDVVALEPPQASPGPPSS
jgi:multidrug efflux pump subunit AcrA (membrane-fusion protein)